MFTFGGFKKSLNHLFMHTAIPQKKAKKEYLLSISIIGVLLGDLIVSSNLRTLFE